MKALWVTSRTNDVDSLVRAWQCWHAGPVVRATFPHTGWPCDNEILDTARTARPDIVFYVGANKGSGIPSLGTLKALRGIAPSVNLCCDGGDEPWHATLAYYAKAGCFDLQVTLDGHRGAPVDLVTVTPVDPRPYEGGSVARPILCGFSGGMAGIRNVFPAREPAGSRAPRRVPRPRPATALPAWAKTHHPVLDKLASRNQIIGNLEADKTVEIRRRSVTGSYADHAAFLKSCRIVLNTSFSGSGETHHIKGRVLEAGWAGCALLESMGSPIAEWFPAGAYRLYRDAAEARRMIGDMRDEEIAEMAAVLADHVRQHYHPRQIFGAILERLGVAAPDARPAP